MNGGIAHGSFDSWVIRLITICTFFWNIWKNCGLENSKFPDSRSISSAGKSSEVCQCANVGSDTRKGFGSEDDSRKASGIWQERFAKLDVDLLVSAMLASETLHVAQLVQYRVVAVCQHPANIAGSELITHSPQSTVHVAVSHVRRLKKRAQYCLRMQLDGDAETLAAPELHGVQMSKSDSNFKWNAKLNNEMRVYCNVNVECGRVATLPPDFDWCAAANVCTVQCSHGVRICT